jgi:integrase
MSEKKQKPRRTKGEGCISQRPDGTWSGYLTKPNGKRKWVYRKTKKAVSEELTRLRAKQLDGHSLESDRITLGVYLDRWLEDTQRIKVKPTTLSKQHGLAKNHIKPHIGSVQLRKLSTEHLNALQTTLETQRKPASVYVRHDVHKLLNAVLRHAVRNRKILSNPAELANRPKIPTAERTTLNAEQLGRFVKAVKGHEYESLFILAAVTGMRQGECLGLQWDDIDFEAGTISIKRTLAQIGRKDMRAYQPKTKASARTIRPHGLALGVLQEHQKRMQEQFPESAWVFVWKDGGPVPRRNLYRIFKELLAKAKCPSIRFHDLRHTAGTLLMAAGENPKIVSSLLGHSNVSITLGLYSHASEDMTAKAANTLGELAAENSKNEISHFERTDA